MVTLDKRKEIASEARKQGYNCAQAVMLAFTDKACVDAEALKRLGSGLGSGVGGEGEICGAILGMGIIDGMQHGSEPADKIRASKDVRELVEAFRKENGCVLCRELKAHGKSCDSLVLNAVEILHNKLQ